MNGSRPCEVSITCKLKSFEISRHLRPPGNSSIAATSSPREQGHLANELAELTDWLERLETATVQIAVFGLVGRGKSSLLNALLGREAFVTGAIHGVTQRAEQVNWQVETLGR